MSPSATFRATDVRVWFDTPLGHVRAVDGVTFAVEAGRTIGIVGESGSGKSALARTLLGLVPHNALVDTRSRIGLGDAEFAPTSRDAERARGVDIAMVFQDSLSALTPVVRIGRQLTEPLRQHLGLSADAARRRAIEILERVRISEPERRMRQYPHELSGGMRQRVVIALAIACNPKVLIADEPTTALDVTIQQQVLNLLDGLVRSQGMAMVLISHDLGVVANRTDHIAVMYAGRIVETAPTAELFAAPRHPYTAGLLGCTPRLSNPPHTRLATIPGRPPIVIDPQPGCRFAARCPRVQERCRTDEPVLGPADGSGHRHACFFPLGDDDGPLAPDVRPVGLPGANGAGDVTRPECGMARLGGDA